MRGLSLDPNNFDMTYIAELDFQDQRKILGTIASILSKNPNGVAKIEVTYLPKAGSDDM